MKTKGQGTRRKEQGVGSYFSLFPFLFSLGCVLAAGAASAQPYPARPIRLVVGYSAGGATDITARLIAQKLSETIGQQVLVDNRPGAGSTLASELVARSAPDGYTVLFSNATIAMPSLFARLSFDVRKDLAAVSLVGYGPLVLVVHPSLPVKSIRDLVALARRKPGMLNYGSAGVGSMTHLAMALFVSMTNAEMVHVPYKGSTQASVGIISGEAQLMFSSPAAVMSQTRDGKLRPLAVSGTTRSAVLPGVPTLIEAGIAGYDATSWYGALAPSATPRRAVSRLAEETAKALTTADLKERLLTQGIEPARGGAEEFAGYLNGEILKWTKIIQAAGIPPQ